MSSEYDRKQRIKLLEEVLGNKTRLRILRVLAKGSELTISKLSREVSMSKYVLRRHLQILLKSDLIVKKRYGTSTTYMLNLEKPEVKALTECFHKINFI